MSAYTLNVQHLSGHKEFSFTPRKDSASNLKKIEEEEQKDVVSRIKQFVNNIKNRLSTCPTPEFFSRKQLQAAWVYIQTIEWRSVVQGSILSQSGQEKGLLLEKVNAVVSNALSFVKNFFRHSTLIQKILQSPKLFSGFSLVYGFYKLYFLVSDFFTKEDGWAVLYSSLDIIENLGSMADSSSGFILGLREVDLISPDFTSIVTSLAPISMAFSLVSTVSKGIAIAHLKDWIKELEKVKSNREKLLTLYKKEPLLLKRLFSIESKLITEKIRRTFESKKSDIEKNKEIENLVSALK